ARAAAHVQDLSGWPRALERREPVIVVGRQGIVGPVVVAEAVVVTELGQRVLAGGIEARELVGDLRLGRQRPEGHLIAVAAAENRAPREAIEPRRARATAHETTRRFGRYAQGVHVRATCLGKEGCDVTTRSP